MARFSACCTLLLIFCAFSNAQECLQNFADIENVLLSIPDNLYHISKAFFQPRSEGESVCITAYYYLGAVNPAELKQTCPDISVDGNGTLTGCSKWKWCSNSFYIGLNLTQLEMFSLYIIREKVSEVELFLPELCISEATLDEYLLRITTSLKLYSKGEGTLGEGAPFVGYAAKFTTLNDMETLTLEFNENSQEALNIPNQMLRSDFDTFDLAFLCICLIALPTFVAPTSAFVFLDLRKKYGKKTREERSNLFPFFLGFITTCLVSTAVMLLFQMAAYDDGGSWYYVIPYTWLWTLVVAQFLTSLLVTHKYMSTCKMLKHKRSPWMRPSYWLQSFALWIIFGTVLLLSWHVVFAMIGFVLNPFRAILFTIVIFIIVVCVTIISSVIFSFLSLAYKTLRVKKCHIGFALIYLLLMVAVITVIFSYIAFMIRINSDKGDNVQNGSVIALIAYFLPPLMLLAFTWCVMKQLLKLPKQVSTPEEDEDDDEKKDDVISLKFDEKFFANANKHDSII